MSGSRPPLRGRGTAANPANRFERRLIEADADAAEPEAPLPRTRFLKDTARTIIARNDSPDVGFDASVNPYRGCEHGCAYCYARPTHEALLGGEEPEEEAGDEEEPEEEGEEKEEEEGGEGSPLDDIADFLTKK